MRVSIYKAKGFPEYIQIEASPGKGRPPVLLKGITRENLVGTVGQTIQEMRSPKGAERPQPQ